MQLVRLLALGMVAVVACARREPPRPDVLSPPEEPVAPVSAEPEHGAGDAGRTAAAADAGDAGEENGHGAVLAPFHVIGRVDRRDPAALRIGYPGVEIRARVDGGDLVVTFAESGVSHWDATVDGAPRAPIVVSGPERAYVVPVESAGLHEVVLTKRTETLLGVTTLRRVSVAAPGVIVPSPALAGRRIEIVGDSITCGFGVLGADETCPFSAETESEPSAWAAVAARSLGALHSSVCFSGLGVARNFDGTVDTMLPRYARSVADDATSSWDHAFRPDVVVVALGTNDFAGGKGDPGPAFGELYVAFLAELRTIHPTATIVLATSPMLTTPNRTTLRTYLEAAMSLRAAAGDTAVTLLDIEVQDEAGGMGCGYHPNLATQARMGAALAAHLESVMGW